MRKTSSHSKWDVSLVGKWSGWILPLIDKHEGGGLLWLSLRPPACPRQEKTACICCAWSLLSKGPGQLSIWSIVSCHALAPPLTSSGRVYFPLTMNKLLQMLHLSQRSSPFLWAPIFQTRLWTISTWNTKAHVFICFSEKEKQKCSLG